MFSQLSAPILVFAITATIGVTLALQVLRGRMVPWLYSLTHALFGATGLVLLYVYITMTVGVSAWTLLALSLFLFVAFAGFFLASFHLRGKVPPPVFVLIHAGLAVTAFVLLLLQWLLAGA